MTTDVLMPSCSIVQDEFIPANLQNLKCRKAYQKIVSSNFAESGMIVYSNQYYQQTLHQQQNQDSFRYYSHKIANKQNNYDTAYVKNTVAQAVITRLHRWCCQLFWLTIVCVIGCCGELQKSKSKTIAEVRRTIFNNSLRRCKDLNDLEVQLLHHLTNPQPRISMIMRPLRVSALRRRYQLSRPPSLQLFVIFENEEVK